MFIILVYFVVFAVYFISPLHVRLLIFLANFLMPDPIPILDEVIMIAGIIGKLNFLVTIGEFISEHKKAILNIIIAGIIATIVLSVL